MPSYHRQEREEKMGSVSIRTGTAAGEAEATEACELGPQQEATLGPAVTAAWLAPSTYTAAWLHHTPV